MSTSRLLQVTSAVRLETGTFAWLAAGLLCMLGLGCCACVPLCLDSLKVTRTMLYCTVLYCTVYCMV